MNKRLEMFKHHEIQNTLILNITKVDERIWKYISDEKNWCEAKKRSYWEPDKAGEFGLLDFKTIEEFDKMIEEEGYKKDFGEDTVEFNRLMVLEILNTKQDLSKIDKVLFDYSW